MNDIAADFFEFKMTSAPTGRMEIPYGEYEVKLVDINLKASKTGKPMITIQFEIMGAYNEANNKVLHQYHWVNVVVLNSKDPSDKKNRFFFGRAIDTLADLGYEGTIEDLKDVAEAVEAIKKSIERKDAFYEIEICDERGYKTTEIGARLED